MLIVVNRYEYKRNNKRIMRYIGVLNTETLTITYYYRPILVGKLLNNEIEIKGAVITKDRLVRFSAVEHIFIKQNNTLGSLELRYPYRFDLRNLHGCLFKFAYKTDNFYYTLYSIVDRETNNIDAPYLCNKDGNDVKFIMYSSAKGNFGIGTYIKETKNLCEHYNVVKLTGFPRYRHPILDLSELYLPSVVDYSGLFSDVVSKVIIMCKIDLSKLCSLRTLICFSNYYTEVVDFSNCFNDLGAIYDEELFVLSISTLKRVIFVLPNAPKFINVIKKKNHLSFGGYCNKDNKETVIKSLVSKTFLLGKETSLYIIQNS